MLFLGGLKFTETYQKGFLFLTESIKTTYHDFSSYLQNIIIKYLKQEETISSLLLENRKLKKYYLELNATKKELESLKKECNVNTKFYLDVKLIRAISYTTLGDFSSMWIEMDDFNQTKIYGLIKDDFAAGIVVNKNGKPIALLNSNEKCAYAVEIGRSKAPGIAMGKRNGTMVVKFIPMYKNIKIGDEVVTSGMDNIFFYGIKVGKVIKIESMGSYKVAIVKPYADLANPRYFWIVLNSR